MLNKLQCAHRQEESMWTRENVTEEMVLRALSWRAFQAKRRAKSMGNGEMGIVVKDGSSPVG